MVSAPIKVYIIVALAAGLVGVYGNPKCPRHRGLPDGFSRTENKYRSRALFRLDLRSAIKGYVPEKEYRFRVHTTARKFKFNDASLSIDALDEECGAGIWMTEDDGLYSPKDCPSIVTTQQKQPMGRAHFKWRAPSCGCVHFRVRVHVNSTYYLEDKNVHNGPLARTICPQVPKTNAPATDVPLTTTVKATLFTRNERLQLLCDVTDNHDVEDVIKNEDFMSKRTLSKMNSFELERLSIAVERRHLEILKCCALIKEIDRTECFGDIRRIRIDTFCGSGEPDIPLSKIRYDWIKQKQSECCPEIGESRYKCFNHTLYESDMLKDSPNHHISVDMDDFDPVNYIEDYPRADKIKEKFSKHVKQTTEPDEHSGVEMTTSNVQYKHDKESKVVGTKTIVNHGVYDDDTDNNDNIDKNDENDDNGEEDENNKKDYDDDNDDENENTDDADNDDTLGDGGLAKDDDHHRGVNDHSKQHPEKQTSEDEVNDAEQREEESKKNDVKDRYLSLEECCMNGIDAGTRLMAEGFAGCFVMADKFDNFFTKWSRKCDRHFVICCMRVIDGLTSTRRPLI